MSYDPAVLRRATARLEGERRAREERQQALRRAACQRQPRLSEIDRQLRGTMTELFAASLRRGGGALPRWRRCGGRTWPSSRSGRSCWPAWIWRRTPWMTTRLPPVRGHRLEGH